MNEGVEAMTLCPGAARATHTDAARATPTHAARGPHSDAERGPHVHPPHPPPTTHPPPPPPPPTRPRPAPPPPTRHAARTLALNAARISPRRAPRIIPTQPAPRAQAYGVRRRSQPW